jgi:hypothetical protein
MKTKNTLVLVLVFAFLIGFYPSQILAEDVQAPAVPAEEEPIVEFEGAEFSYGTVKSVAGDQLVVSEYDYENDNDIDVTYSVSPEATFEGVASLSEIAAGDSVDIDYEIKDGQKVAVSIAVEKAELEELGLSAEELTAVPEAQSAEQQTVTTP